LDPPEQTLAVRTNEDEDIGYDFDGLDGLNPADAMTIHRSQVMENPVVVVPLIISAWMMSQRDLVFAVVQRESAAAVVDHRPWR
jgi:exodeoxyribonuclease V alpha subunit